MKNKKSTMFIPKNIGTGPNVAIDAPNTIRSYASQFACTVANTYKKTIIKIGAIAIYIPKGASSPQS